MTRARSCRDGRGPCALRGAALTNIKLMTRIERINRRQQLPDATTGADFKGLDAGRVFPPDAIHRAYDGLCPLATGPVSRRQCCNDRREGTPEEAT
jgi:hypothetical protein